MTFWRDAALLRAEYEKHGTLAGVSRAHGGTPAERTLVHWWAKLGLPALPRGGPRVHAVPADDTASGWLIEALRKRKGRASIEELADEFDTAPKNIRTALESLGILGYRIQEEASEVVLERVPNPTNLQHKVLFDGEVYRFGIISDVHLNSKHCRLEELHIAYDMLVDEGIETVYNPGDIVSGRGIFRGQDHEIINHTFETQCDYAVENYPLRPSITTKIISGNHDCEGDFLKAGADACLNIANRRDDLEWCGRYAADFSLPNGTVMTMRHPMGGSSYAKSYKPQKFAESFEGGTKPGVVLFGHWHNMEWGIHRNIHMLNCGTFEGYGGSLGLRVPLGAPALGFFIVEMTLADDSSVVRFKPEWFPFFSGRKVAKRKLRLAA